MGDVLSLDGSGWVRLGGGQSLRVVSKRMLTGGRSSKPWSVHKAAQNMPDARMCRIALGDWGSVMMANWW